MVQFAQAMQTFHLALRRQGKANNLIQNEVLEHQLESLDDEELMASYQQGQLAAFDTLYHRHKGPLYRYFLRQCREQSQAEDLYQDVWSRVIKASEGYQPSAKFTTWLYRIAYNRMIDHSRTLKTVNKLNSQALEDAPEAAIAQGQDPQQQSEQAQQLSYLKLCLSLLPPKQLDVFMLKEEGGFSAAMIAEIVEISQEAIKSRLRYSYQKLRECIAGKMQGAANER